MQRLPEEELKEALSLIKKDSMLDNQTALRIKKKINEIDHVLARHYGFTDEELYFIINCDIKYRMGIYS